MTEMTDKIKELEIEKRFLACQVKKWMNKYLNDYKDVGGHKLMFSPSVDEIMRKSVIFRKEQERKERDLNGDSLVT